MKRVLFLALALLLSVAPNALAQKQTFTGSWDWMWPNDTLRETFPNIRATAVDSDGNVFVSMIADDSTDGLYVSRDNGQTFSRIENLVGRFNFNDIWSICLADSNDLLIGVDQYLFKSTDAGRNWYSVLYNPNERYSALVYVGNDTILAGGGLGIYRSTDNGCSWTESFVSNSDSSFAVRKFNFVSCFTVASNDYIYAGTGSGLGTYSYGILRSTDGGRTWSYANNGITNTVPDTADFNADIISMASVGDTVFAASTHLYRSTDNGQSWQAIADNLFYNNESGAIFASKKGLIVPTLTGLWMTPDRGATWDLLIDFGSAINVWSAAQGPNDSTVYVGMWNGLGKLTIDDPITAVVTPPSVPRNFSLSQNYPNPFNPTTTIEYSLPQRTNVNLTVYNVLGEKVTTLANGMEGPGQHQVIFDGSSLASGTYLYVLEAGTYRSVQKMMLIK